MKCVYIDPPYNTGSAFEHYDDNMEHTIWLSMMYPRLKLLKQFLREDGFICCQINDDEGAYLKVIMDEIFSRTNYISTMFVQVRYAEKTLKQDMTFHKQIEQIHIYRKSYKSKPNLNTTESNFDKFTFYINEKGKGKPTTLGNKKAVIFQSNEYEIIEGEGSEDRLKEIWASGTILDGNSSGRFFRDYLTGRYNIDGYGVLYKVYGIGDDKFDYRYFTGPKRQGATKGKYYQGVPLDQLENPYELKYLPIENYIDFAADFGNCRSEGSVEFRSGKKPEVLLRKILAHFSNEGDLILDSFLGSATTIAVAHKMKRRYIGIEMGKQAHTHCYTRLKNVIDGDKTGISEAVGWKGGGGFRFFSLGEAIFDSERRIKPDISFENLAAHIYFTETKTPMNKPKKKSPFLGVHDGTAYALLYNGVLGDKSVSGGNVLTHATLNHIMHDIDMAAEETGGDFAYNQMVIYGEAARLTHVSLASNNIIFKQTPYDIKVW
ncbi:MAG: site-specific DNA-methyltransferase [Treponema sp.]|nr:site-specific DNA-methyltransferase [Treponema sp.]